MRRPSAVLAADVAGHSRLMGADEAGAPAALRRLRGHLLPPHRRQTFCKAAARAMTPSTSNSIMRARSGNQANGATRRCFEDRRMAGLPE